MLKLAIQVEAGREWVMYHWEMDEIQRDTSAGTQGRMNKRKKPITIHFYPRPITDDRVETKLIQIEREILTCEKGDFGKCLKYLCKKLSGELTSDLQNMDAV